MSKRLTFDMLLFLFCSFIASLITIAVLTHPPQHPPFSDSAAIMLAWVPSLWIAVIAGIRKLHWHLRAPDVVIAVMAPPTPLMARFLEQDRLLEKREQLKRQLFDLNSDIETFNANLTPDERRAWFNRPGPHGK